MKRDIIVLYKSAYGFTKNTRSGLQKIYSVIA